MRQKLNENPLYQAAFIGVLALLIGLMLMLRMGGGGASPPPEAGDTGTLTPSAADPAAAVAPAAPGGVAPVDAGGSAPTPAASPSGDAELKAGPGLPEYVASSYNGGDTVGLLVLNHRGIDDRDLAATVATVGTRSGVAVFVSDVKNVADYSRITEGVDLNRTPALVVLRPKHLTDGSMPTATVAYGFRGAGSVQQAFADALYDGRSDLPYYP